jgi:hypothetical protein
VRAVEEEIADNLLNVSRRDVSEVGKARLSDSKIEQIWIWYGIISRRKEGEDLCRPGSCGADIQMSREVGFGRSFGKDDRNGFMSAATRVRDLMLVRMGSRGLGAYQQVIAELRFEL